MNLSLPEYLSLKALSSGMAHTLLNDSPHMAWFGSPWNPDLLRDDSTEADMGTYAHAMLLEGGLGEKLVIVQADDWRTKAAKAERDAARAEGKTPILAHKVAGVKRMVEEAHAFIARTELRGIFTNGHPEQSFTWKESGVDCKIRPDLMSADRLVHLSYKTTPGTAHPQSWIRRILPLHEISAPFYERGIRACFGVERCKTVFLVQSQNAPYACSLVALAPSRQDFAERQLDTAIAIWRDCLANKRFPAYPTEIHYAEADAYRTAAFTEQYSDEEIERTLEAMKS